MALAATNPMNDDRVQVVREPQTGEASIVVDCVSVMTIPIDAGEDRRAYNRRIDQMADLAWAVVARLEKED